jgi:DHA2 family multidrug resistance protein-like MFS transporter
VRYISPPNLIAIGFVVAAFGFGMLTQTGTAYDLPVIATAYAVFSVGLAPVFTLASDLIVSTAPSERAGTAAGISEMSAELGGALGIALLGSLVTAIYRGAVGDAIIGDLPPATIDAARDTLGAALSVAEALGNQLGADLANTSRSAFVAAFQAAALASVVITLIAAAATAIVLGRSSLTKPVAVSETDVNGEVL